MKIPKPTPLGELPPTVVKACYELIAHAMNTNSEQLMIALNDLKVQGMPAPGYEVVVRKLP